MLHITPENSSGGAKNYPRAVLTETQAIEIYSYRKPKASRQMTDPILSGRSAAVAKKFNISPKAIRDIWNRRTWTQETQHLWTEDERPMIRTERWQKKLAQHLLSVVCQLPGRFISTCRPATLVLPGMFNRRMRNRASFKVSAPTRLLQYLHRQHRAAEPLPFPFSLVPDVALADHPQHRPAMHPIPKQRCQHTAAALTPAADRAAARRCRRAATHKGGGGRGGKRCGGGRGEGGGGGESGGDKGGGGMSTRSWEIAWGWSEADAAGWSDSDERSAALPNADAGAPDPFSLAWPAW
jgi:uncharacterized membrane protein YgcG